MTHTLGIDIGTFETKGVLVDARGRILAEARHPHRMLVPRPGWAEHRAEEDWWGDFVRVAREILARSGIDPREITAVATSAIGPCMLPVDAVGAPLMNAVLYGVDTRATAQIAALDRQIGADRILATCGNALTSQSVGPKILWLKEERPELFARTAMVLTSTSYLVWKLTGEYVIDHYTAANFSPLYDVNRLDWTVELADFITLDRLPRLMWSTEIAGRITAAAAPRPAWRRRHPRHLRHHRRRGRGDLGRRAAPGEMMMMYGSTIFIIQVTGRRCAIRGCGMRPGCFPACMPRWRGWRQAAP
jgi:xylulokinase